MTDRDHYTDTLLDFALRDFHGKESPPDLSGRIVAAVTARSLSPSHGEERGKGKIIAHPRPRWIGIATAAASVVIGLMLIVLGPERHQKPVSFEARYEIENNEIKLLEGWLLIDSASPLLRTDNGHVESVRGKVLARAGGVPDRAALEAAAEWFDTTLTQEERTMLGNTKRWINTGSVALIALSGSFVCNGVTYTAQDGVAGEVPSDGVAAKTWAESFEVIENVFDKQSGTTMTETFAPSAQLIVDANAWEAFWDKLWEIEKQRSKRADLGTPNIDFTKYAVIAVIDRVEYMEPTDAGDDTGAGIELEAIYREVRTSDDIACVLRCKPVTSKGETILWRDPVTAGDAKKRGPFDDAMSRTLYGCFVVPAADAPQPGKVRVEYQLRTMAVPGKSRIDLTKEGILDSWKYLGTLSIGVARNPKWFKENIIQVEHYLPETAAYTSLLDGGAAYDGQVKDQSGNVVKNLIRYYSVDERVQTVGDRTDQVKRQFDTDWGEALKEDNIDPYGDKFIKGGLNFDTHDVIVVYGLFESMHYYGFNLEEVVENDSSTVVRLDPIKTWQSGNDPNEELDKGEPYAMIVLPRSKRAIHVEMNIGGTGNIGMGDSPEAIAKRQAWHLLKTIGGTPGDTVK